MWVPFVRAENDSVDHGTPSARAVPQSRPLTFCVCGKINSFVPVLACRDRTLRVMKHGGVRYQVDVSGPPSTLHLFYGDGGSSAEYLLYGTSDAAIGCVQIGR